MKKIRKQEQLMDELEKENRSDNFIISLIIKSNEMIFKQNKKLFMHLIK